MTQAPRKLYGLSNGWPTALSIISFLLLQQVALPETTIILLGPTRTLAPRSCLRGPTWPW